jgi:hypothetical protein
MMIPVRGPRSLSSLLEDLRAARAVVQRARGLSCGAMATRDAQQDLLVCLLAFTDELLARRLPVPHALHAEARLYDDLLAVTRS